MRPRGSTEVRVQGPHSFGSRSSEYQMLVPGSALDSVLIKERNREADADDREQSTTGAEPNAVPDSLSYHIQRVR
jgi:hypothetical protein